MKCLVCKKESENYTIRIEVGNFGPPRDGSEVLADVCSNCGNMRLKGAHTQYMKKLASTGFPKITADDIARINVQEILDQMVLPGRFIDEKKVWIDSVFANHGEHGHVRENDYKNDFGKFEGKVPAIAKSKKIRGKYARLVHFLLLDKKERQENFGGIKCPAIEVTKEGFVSFKDGYHRFTLLRFLGATNIPVAMTQESIDNAKKNGIKVK